LADKAAGKLPTSLNYLYKIICKSDKI
jgi:hypothetical protein